MRNCIVCVCLALAPASFGAQDPEKLFQVGKFQEALNALQAVPAPKDADLAFQRTFRILEAQALLFRYDQAAQAAMDLPEPSSAVNRGYYYLLRAELGREVLLQYGRRMPEDAQPGAKDVTTWTSAQWHTQIQRDYRQLLDLRDTLIDTPISKASYFVNVKGTDTEAIPTVWDLAVDRWTDYLTHHHPDKDKWGPFSLAQAVFTPSLSEQARADHLALSLWEDAAQRPGPGRETARTLWLLARTWPPWVSLDAKDADQARAVLAKVQQIARSAATPRGKSHALAVAARLQVLLEDESEALRSCQQAQSHYPTQQCLQIESQITRTELEVESSALGPTTPGKAQIRARNLNRVYVRLYPVSAEQLERLAPLLPKTEWASLRYLPKQTASQLLSGKPAHQSSSVLKAPRAHAWAEAGIDLPPALAPGPYALLVTDDAAFAPTARHLRGAIVNVSDLYLFAARLNDESKGGQALAVQAFDAAVGLPAQKTTLYIRRSGTGKESAPAASTQSVDDAGRALIRTTASQVDPLGKYKQNLAWLSAPAWLSLSKPDRRLVFYLNSDREIYRFGDKVRLRITGLTHTLDGPSVARGVSTRVQARDASGNEFFKKTVKLSALGSADLAFSLPKSGMNGRFSIQVSGQIPGTNTLGNGTLPLQVESYSKPEFEIRMDEAPATLVYGSQTKVRGTARFLFGAPVVSAPFEYRWIRRHALRFPWAPAVGSALGGLPRLGGTPVESGSGETGPDGTFEVPWQDPGLQGPHPSQMVLELRVTGPSGRSLEHRQAFAAGPAIAGYTFKWLKAFASPTSQAVVQIQALGADAKPAKAQFQAELSLLALPAEPSPEMDASRWKAQLHTLRPHKTIRTLSVAASAEGAVVTLPKLDPGIYRLSIGNPNACPEATACQTHWVVHGDKSPPPVGLSAVALAEKETYEVGQVATLLIGSAQLQGQMAVEVWQSDRRLSASMVPAGVRLHGIPITKQHRGGITVRWFGVYQHRVRSGQVSLPIAWTDRVLHLALDVPKRVSPGTRSRFALALTTPEGKPVTGEAFLRVTDQALKYYAPPPPSWVEALYPSHAPPEPNRTSFETTRFNHIVDNSIPPSSALVPPTLERPHLRPTRSRLVEGGFASSAYSTHSVRTMAPGLATLSAAAPASEAVQAHSPTGANTSGLRQEFFDTAYFGPRIAMPNGKAEVEFAFSDALTAWSVEGFALDAELRWAVLKTQTATALDFFATTRAPRFVREGETTSFTTTVHNSTARTLSARVSATVQFLSSVPGQNVTLAALVKTARVPAHGSSTVSWPVKVPTGTGTASVQVVATAQKHIDRHKVTLPWLAGKQRMVLSTVQALEPGAPATLTLAAGKKDLVEKVTLQIDPQQTTALLQALPGLSALPHKDVVSTVVRYVPLAVVKRLFDTTPGLAQAMKKLKRGTRASAWDEADPSRLIGAEETPWAERAAAGDSGKWIDLWDEATVSKLEAQTWQHLKKLQKPSGAFSWFSGGEDDPALTFYVLEQLALAKHHGVAVPVSVAAKALPYLKGSVPHWLEPQSPSPALALHAAYVMSSHYPKNEWGAMAEAALALADRHREAMTPYGRAIAADLAFRLGQNKRGDEWMDLALDGAQQNAWGVYWAPEARSWQWYRDTVAKHAFFLRLLLNHRPEDSRIPGMVKWLLFSRKATQWESARASAAAVLALIDFQKSKGFLFQAEAFNWNWAGRKHSIRLPVDQPMPEKLRWTEYGKAASGALQATVHKTSAGVAFASLAAVVQSAEGGVSDSGVLSVRTRFFERKLDAQGNSQLSPLTAQSRPAPGTQVLVQILLQAQTPLEYIHVRVPRASGFEPAQLTSGWNWTGLAHYYLVENATDSFFIPQLPQGEVVLSARFFATTAGESRFGPVQAASLYSADLTATDAATSLHIAPQ